MEGFMLAIAGVITIVLAAIGVNSMAAGKYIRPADFVKAQELCVDNDGVKHIELDAFDVDVQCNDGAEFNNVLYQKEAKP